ncbi:MAG: hypothetical protein NC218_01755 [Acetobacter sp.]|nr:hypothetical protein [Acetobacter sp.]
MTKQDKIKELEHKLLIMQNPENGWVKDTAAQAEELVTAGYQKKSDTVQEFAERLQFLLEERSVFAPGLELEDVSIDGEVFIKTLQEVVKEFEV